MVLKPGHFGKNMRNAWKVLKRSFLRIIEKISLIDRVRYEETPQASTKERNILQTINRGKVNWTCHMLRRNCLLKHVIEGNVAVTGRRERRPEQPLDDLKEKRGH